MFKPKMLPEVLEIADFAENSWSATFPSVASCPAKNPPAGAGGF
jgi:hypothetical protein